MVRCWDIDIYFLRLFLFHCEINFDIFHQWFIDNRRRYDFHSLYITQAIYRYISIYYLNDSKCKRRTHYLHRVLFIYIPPTPYPVDSFWQELGKLDTTFAPVNLDKKCRRKKLFFFFFSIYSLFGCWAGYISIVYCV